MPLGDGRGASATDSAEAVVVVAAPAPDRSARLSARLRKSSSAVGRSSGSAVRQRRTSVRTCRGRGAGRVERGGSAAAPLLLHTSAL